MGGGGGGVGFFFFIIILYVFLLPAAYCSVCCAYPLSHMDDLHFFTWLIIMSTPTFSIPKQHGLARTGAYWIET